MVAKIFVVVASILLVACSLTQKQLDQWQRLDGAAYESEKLTQALRDCEYYSKYRRFAADTEAEHFREWVEAKRCMRKSGYELRS